MVAPNTPYLVGERGAELFVPSSSGQVVPNGGFGGVTVNQSINVSTGISQTVRAEIMNMLPLIKGETINAVAETRRRGGSFARTFGA
jgi:phage-related minor tail protein